MDMEAAFDLQAEDACEEVNGPAASGLDYLRQVAAERHRCADVVVATKSYAKYVTKQTVKVESATSSAGHNNSAKPLAPPEEWQHRQVADFSDVRQRLVTERAQLERARQLPKFKLPSIGAEDAWNKFCFQKCAAEIADHHAELGETHKGTPPLLKLVLALPQANVMDLLGFHVEWLQEEGYSPARGQWLYALMAVVEKPLDPDVCASLRSLARYCTTERAKLTSEDALQQTFSWFICIVARYFDQADLRDC